MGSAWANTPLGLGASSHLCCVHPWSLLESLLVQCTAMWEEWPEKPHELCLIDLYLYIYLSIYRYLYLYLYLPMYTCLSPEVMTRTFPVSSTGWASTPWCFQATTGSELSNIFPAKNIPLWKIHSCLHHVVFPAASEILHGRVEISEETWVTGSCRRSWPLEPVPSKWAWGIYSPPSAHTLFLPTAMWVFCVLSAEVSNMRAECVPVPCLLLFFQVPHLWTRARFPPAQGVWMSWVGASGGRGCPWGAEGAGLEGRTNQPCPGHHWLWDRGTDGPQTLPGQYALRHCS